MSDVIQPEYADEPTLCVREKKKGSLPRGQEVGAPLRTLPTKQAVGWKPGSAPLVRAPAPH